MDETLDQDFVIPAPESDPAHAEHGYRVLRVLGRTEAAGRTTLLAEDASGREVVLKHFAFSQPSAGWDGYSTSELEALLRIQHPRVPRYLASYRTGQHGFCLVQTFLGAPPIDTRQAWPLDETLLLARQLLEVLVHLEDRIVPPVIHGDVSPGNIRHDAEDVDGDGEVFYLVDFVLTREKLTELGLRSRVAGTPGFVAPERVRGARGDARSDLYGLGMTVACLLAAVPQDEAQDRLHDAHGGLRLDALPEDVRRNDGLVRWLQRMTAADHHERFNHARNALRALPSVPVSRPAANPPPQPPSPVEDVPPVPATAKIDRTAPGGDFVRAMLTLMGVAAVLILIAMWLG